MIYITGDTHADFNMRLSKKYFPADKNDYLIICGDFGGVWDDSNSERYWLKWLSEKPFTTLFISGNHENFDMLAEFPISEWNGGKVQYIRDNVIHLMRGQVFEIEGSRFFTMGGASSHDIRDGILDMDDPYFKAKLAALRNRMALFRINHLSWWKEELPSDEEYQEAERNLNKYDRKVDYIITHCAPTSISDIIGRGLYMSDRLTDYLETVYQSCSFKHWFFGHYHENKIIGEKFILLYESIVCYDTIMLVDDYMLEQKEKLNG